MGGGGGEGTADGEGLLPFLRDWGFLKMRRWVALSEALTRPTRPQRGSWLIGDLLQGPCPASATYANAVTACYVSVSGFTVHWI